MSLMQMLGMRLLRKGLPCPLRLLAGCSGFCLRPGRTPLQVANLRCAYCNMGPQVGYDCMTPSVTTQADAVLVDRCRQTACLPRQVQAVVMYRTVCWQTFDEILQGTFVANAMKQKGKSDREWS